MAPIGKGREKRRIFRVHKVTEALQLEILDDAILQQAGQVCRCGNTKARPDFFGDGASSDELPSFEHEHTAARPREVGRRHQPIVPSSGDDGVKSHLARRAKLAKDAKKART